MYERPVTSNQWGYCRRRRPNNQSALAWEYMQDGSIFLRTGCMQDDNGKKSDNINHQTIFAFP